MFKIILLDESVEFWNIRIIQKIRKLKNGNWQVVHFNYDTTEIKNFHPYN